MPDTPNVYFDDEMLFEIVSNIVKDEVMMEKIDVSTKKAQPVR